MDANEYQAAAARTLIMEPDTTFTNEELAIMFSALELGAAVGKVLDYIKKGICHRHGFERIEMATQLAFAVQMATKLMALKAPYQQLPISGNDQMLIWCALGLGGESGEIMEEASMIRHFDLFNLEDMLKELGDNDWYNAALCTLIGVPMSDVMQANIDKLKRRFPDGWGSEASKARVDTL